MAGAGQSCCRAHTAARGHSGLHLISPCSRGTRQLAQWSKIERNFRTSSPSKCPAGRQPKTKPLQRSLTPETSAATETWLPGSCSLSGRLSGTRVLYFPPFSLYWGKESTVGQWGSFRPVHTLNMSWKDKEVDLSNNFFVMNLLLLWQISHFFQQNKQHKHVDSCAMPH